MSPKELDKMNFLWKRAQHIWFTHKDLILLLHIGGLYALGMFISNTFINIYLWKQVESFWIIGLYNLCIYVFQTISFALAGVVAKRIDRIYVIRIGMMLLALFFLAVLLFNDQASEHIFILGTLIGIGYGCYWMSFKLLTFENTEPETRELFNGCLGGLESITGIIGPSLAGFLISRLTGLTGYSVIFAISFCLFLIAIAISFFISQRNTKGQFNIRYVIDEKKRNNNWSLLLQTHFLEGLRDGVFLFVISIWIFMIIDSELRYGVINTVVSLLAFISYFVVLRIIRSSRRPLFILIGSILMYVAVIFILLPELFTGQLMVYAIILGIAEPIFYVAYASFTYDVIGKASEAGLYRMEYIVLRELYVSVGRIVSVLCFLGGIFFFQNEQVITILILIFGCSYIGMYFVIKKTEVMNKV